jgi:hypothetical protein
MALVLIFGFFIIAKIHAYKFRDYSIYIEPVTKILALVLVILAVYGYYLIYTENQPESGATKTVEETSGTEIY